MHLLGDLRYFFGTSGLCMKCWLCRGLSARTSSLWNTIAKRVPMEISWRIRRSSALTLGDCFNVGGAECDATSTRLAVGDMFRVARNVTGFRILFVPMRHEGGRNLACQRRTAHRVTTIVGWDYSFLFMKQTSGVSGTCQFGEGRWEQHAWRQRGLAPDPSFCVDNWDLSDDVTPGWSVCQRFVQG